MTYVKQQIDISVSIDSTSAYVISLEESAIKLKMTSVYRLWHNFICGMNSHLQRKLTNQCNIELVRKLTPTSHIWIHAFYFDT